MNSESNSYEIYSSVNPFERETPFRQSVSEKRRLTQQANPSAVQWKQQSFHETRTNSERSEWFLAANIPANLIFIQPFVVLELSVYIHCFSH